MKKTFTLFSRFRTSVGAVKTAEARLAGLFAFSKVAAVAYGNSPLIIY